MTKKKEPKTQHLRLGDGEVTLMRTEGTSICVEHQARSGAWFFAVSPKEARTLARLLLVMVKGDA